MPTLSKAAEQRPYQDLCAPNLHCTLSCECLHIEGSQVLKAKSLPGHTPLVFELRERHVILRPSTSPYTYEHLHSTTPGSNTVHQVQPRGFIFTRPPIWSILAARSRSYGSPATETRTSPFDRYLSKSNPCASPISRRARHGIPYLAQHKKNSSCYPETATLTSLQHSSKAVIGPSTISTTSCTTSSRRQAPWSAPTYVV